MILEFPGGGLGASWNSLMELYWHNLILIDFRIDLGAVWRPKKLPQRIQTGPPEGSKIEHKIQHRMRRLSRPSWIRLGAVLGRFGVDLGVKNNESHRFYPGFVNIVF